MAVTYQAVMDAARLTLNDANKTRWPDTELLQYLNDGLYTLSQYRADLFTTVGDIPCTAGSNEQTLPSGGVALMDIMSVKNGPAVDHTDINSLRSYRPTWRTDAAGPCQNWMYSPEDTDKQRGPNFVIYPQAPANQVLTGQYIATPVPVAYGANPSPSSALPVQDTYSVALQAYVIYRAEMKEEEFVTAERGIQFFAMFEKQIMVADKSEKVQP